MTDPGDYARAMRERDEAWAERDAAHRDVGKLMAQRAREHAEWGEVCAALFPPNPHGDVVARADGEVAARAREVVAERDAAQARAVAAASAADAARVALSASRETNALLTEERDEARASTNSWYMRCRELEHDLTAARAALARMGEAARAAGDAIADHMTLAGMGATPSPVLGALMDALTDPAATAALAEWRAMGERVRVLESSIDSLRPLLSTWYTADHDDQRRVIANVVNAALDGAK